MDFKNYLYAYLVKVLVLAHGSFLNFTILNNDITIYKNFNEISCEI